MNQNEVPWGLVKDLKAEAACGGRRMAQPPSTLRMRQSLTAPAAQVGMKSESVLVGNGSNELLQALFRSAPARLEAVAQPHLSASIAACPQQWSLGG